MNLERDILVSFCSADDRKSDGMEMGWIGEWVHTFQKRLALLWGAAPRLDLNPDCTQFTSFEPESDIHIFLLSNDFFASKPCQSLLQKTLQETKAEKNLLSFFVNLDEIDQNDSMRPIMAYKFYKKDPITETCAPLKPSGETHLDYFLALEDLCFDLYCQVKINDPSSLEFRQKRHKKVFLAHTETELRPYRTRLKWELERFGYQVLPFENWQPQTSRIKDESSFLLDQTDLSIHLIGKNFDLQKNGDFPLSPEYQNKIAADASSKRGLPRLIWVPPGLDITSQSDHYNLVQLRDNPKLIQGAEMLQIPLERLKRLIISNLNSEQKPQTNRKEGKAQLRHQTSIYLIHQFQNPKDLKKVVNILEAEGMKVLSLEKGTSSLETRRCHQNFLKRCDAALIFYEENNELWLETKINDLNKATGMGRSTPILSKALMLSNGATSPNWKGLEKAFHIIDKTPSLKDFIRKLQQKGAQSA